MADRKGLCVSWSQVARHEAAADLLLQADMIENAVERYVPNPTTAQYSHLAHTS